MLGVNIFGVSSIQQAVFVNNTPNCAIVFLDSYSPMENPVLYITDSFLLGTVSGVGFAFNQLAAGLNVIATKPCIRLKVTLETLQYMAILEASLAIFFSGLTAKWQFK